jgi:hypothetical protein
MHGNALLPRLIASLGARAKAPPPGLLEMRRRLHAAAAAANLALDLAMLAKSWLARVHTCVRVPERATSQVTELLKNRRHLRTVLEAKRQQLNSLRASLAKALPTSTTEAPTAMEVDHGGNETTATWPPLARSAARAASMVQLDDAKARERTAAAQSWELRQAIASAQVGLRRQEAALCWLLCSGVPEAVLQLLPGLPNLIQDLECQEELDDGAGAASGDSGQDLVGGGPLTLVLAHSLLPRLALLVQYLACGITCRFAGVVKRDDFPLVVVDGGARRAWGRVCFVSEEAVRRIDDFVVAENELLRFTIGVLDDVHPLPDDSFAFFWNELIPALGG